MLYCRIRTAQIGTLLLLLWTCAATASDEAQECPNLEDLLSGQADQMLRPSFVLFGDSITQRSFDEGGWGARLASEYQRKVDVINRGYSGYNTRWALYLLPRVFSKAQQPPKLVAIFFGANDAALPDRISARQHVPVEEYVRNLHSIIDHIKSVGAEHILLLTPPPLHEPARVKHNQEMNGVSKETQQPERTNEVTGQYAAAVAELAKARQLSFVDLWSQLATHTGWETDFLEDGLHLTPAGNKAVFDLIAAKLRDAPALRLDAIPDDFPSHRDIDEDDPASSFACQ